MNDPTGRHVDVTELLGRVGGADASALDELTQVVYHDLRQRARRLLKDSGGRDSLTPTELVHEAFLRLTSGRDVSWSDRNHFLALAARVMRRILIDHARARDRLKRGGGHVHRSLSDTQVAMEDGRFGVLELDDLLSTLERLDPRHARIAELRLFGGLGMSEIASILDVSLRTVEGDWRLARAWLYRQIGSRDGR
jgi:RNA polymerase sigma factor (TIGR02999 family)